MILTDREILQCIKEGTIVIEPFQNENLGTNSYDVHLGKWLAVYENHELDAKNTIKSDILKLRKKVLYCSPVHFILV